MHGGFHINSDVDRLCVQRKYNKRGLISAVFAIESELRNLSYYAHHSEDPYVELVAGVFNDFEQVGKDYKQSSLSQYLQSWTGKRLHGQLLRPKYVSSISGFGCGLVIFLALLGIDFMALWIGLFIIW